MRASLHENGGVGMMEGHNTVTSLTELKVGSSLVGTRIIKDF